MGIGRINTLATAAVLALAVVGATPSPATASHSWDGYHWPETAGSVEVLFIDSLGARFRDQAVLPLVTKDWGSDAVALSLGDGASAKALRRDCAPLEGSIRVCNADYGARWFGYTDLMMDGEHIAGGSIRINDHYGTGVAYRRFVLCHEMGHALGLDHRSGGSSCLNGGKRPDAHDLDMLMTVYGHNDGATTEGDDECLTCLLGEAASPTAPAAGKLAYF